LHLARLREQIREQQLLCGRLERIAERLRAAEEVSAEELIQSIEAMSDEMSVVADRTIRTILVRVDGAIESSRVLTLPYGARLSDALEQVVPMPQANMDAVQLFRTSVAERQREMLDVS